MHALTRLGRPERRGHEKGCIVALLHLEMACVGVTAKTPTCILRYTRTARSRKTSLQAGQFSRVKRLRRRAGMLDFIWQSLTKLSWSRERTEVSMPSLKIGPWNDCALSHHTIRASVGKEKHLRSSNAAAKLLERTKKGRTPHQIRATTCHTS